MNVSQSNTTVNVVISERTIQIQLVSAVEAYKSELTHEEAALLPLNATSFHTTQFTLGRCAAHAALLAARAPSSPILRGELGEPLWPSGWCGSISHTAQRIHPREVYAAAAVAPTNEFIGIGVDLERFDRQLSSGLVERLCRSEEHPWIDSSARRLLMTLAAKEALYKALAPSSRVYFGFRDASIAFFGKNEFRACVHRALGTIFPKDFMVTGMIVEHAPLLIACVAVPATAREA